MVTTATQSVPRPVGVTTRVLALFLHGPRPSREGDRDRIPRPMRVVDEVEAVTATGLRNRRYFASTRRDGRENPRQVSLIDEGTLARLEPRFGPIPLALVKAQIVLAGDIRLPDLEGRDLIVGEGDDAVVLQLTIERDPCPSMDLIAPDLCEAMKDGELGMFARVLHGGTIRVGQPVTLK